MDELVRDIMTKDLLTISEKDTALKAAQLMSEKGVSSLIVISEEQPIGIITERDVIKKFFLKALILSKLKVDHMRSKIRTSPAPDTTVDVAVLRMMNDTISSFTIIEKEN